MKAGAFADGTVLKKSACQCKRCRFNPWVGKITWRKKWQSTPVFLPRKFPGQKSLVGYSAWGCKKSNITEHTRMHFENVKAMSPAKNLAFYF